MDKKPVFLDFSVICFVFLGEFFQLLEVGAGRALN